MVYEFLSNLNWTAVVGFVATAIILPMARPALAAYVKSRQQNTWATGAVAAAGRVVLNVTEAMEKDPTQSIVTVTRNAVEQEARGFFALYSDVAKQLGAGQGEAYTRVLGEAGNKLAPQLAQAAVAAAVVPPLQAGEMAEAVAAGVTAAGAAESVASSIVSDIRGASTATTNLGVEMRRASDVANNSQHSEIDNGPGVMGTVLGNESKGSQS